MKLPVRLAILAAAMTMGGIGDVQAVVYCQYVGYPVGCVARPGVMLHPRPVARAAVATPGVGAPGVGVRPETPMNRGGPVNRAGRR